MRITNIGRQSPLLGQLDCSVFGMQVMCLCVFPDSLKRPLQQLPTHHVYTSQASQVHTYHDPRGVPYDRSNDERGATHNITL